MTGMAPAELKRPRPVKEPTEHKSTSLHSLPIQAIHMRNVLRGLVWDECHRKALDIVHLALIAEDDKVWTLVRKQLLDVFNAHERAQSAVINQLLMLEEEIENATS